MSASPRLVRLRLADEDATELELPYASLRVRVRVRLPAGRFGPMFPDYHPMLPVITPTRYDYLLVASGASYPCAPIKPTAADRTLASRQASWDGVRVRVWVRVRVRVRVSRCRVALHQW